MARVATMSRAEPESARDGWAMPTPSASALALADALEAGPGGGFGVARRGASVSGVSLSAAGAWGSVMFGPTPARLPSGSRRSTPLPRNWATLRRAVIRRDGGRCVWVEDDGTRCAETGSGPGGGLEVDHLGSADDHSLANLRTLCKWHHARRTARQASAAAGPRLSRRREPERHPGA